MRNVAYLASILLLAVFPAKAAPEGWTEFRGPGRAAVSPETGLLRSWPEDGPKVIWRRPLGEGFSGFAISGEHFYTLFRVGDDEFAGGFRVADGEELWRVRIGKAFSDEFGKGPRATPTLAGDAVYALGGKGNLMSLGAATGEVLWQIDLHKDYPFYGPRWEATGLTAPQVQIPNWGYSGSPLVEGGLVLVETGAREDKSVVAFDAETGKTRWSATGDVLGYASLLAVTLNGRRQILTTNTQELISLLPDGEVYWRHPWPQPTALTQPVFLPPDKIFISHNEAGALLRVGSDGGKPTIEPLWQSRVLKNFWSSSVAYEGRIYGFDNATLKCLSAETGEQRWAKRGLGKGSLVIADGLLMVFGDQGQLTLIEAASDTYDQKGQVRIFDAARTWTPPAIAGGRLYLRGPDEMVCLDLRS